jgi:hypothetical protein
MRRLLIGVGSFVVLSLAVSAAPGCGSDSSSDSNNDGGSSGNADGCTGFGCNSSGGDGGSCVGLECQKQKCDNGQVTTLTGTVLDPAGKVPIYNATVYVPNAELGAIPEGASCDRCDAKISGSPVAITSTGVDGKFSLADVPVVDNLPLVIQIGKWRRKVTVPTVKKCESSALDAGLTRLPRNRNEGNIPRIAVTTGGADPLQCLLRKVGLEDGEFGIAGSEARVHLYAGSGYNDGADHPPAKAITGANAATLPTAESFWSDPANIKKYDVVLLSCEGGENETAAGATKPDASKTAMYEYAKAGGRIFASHYHYVWFSKNPDTTVQGVASWAPPPAPNAPGERTPPGAPTPSTTAVDGTISTAFPKAVAMKQWLANQGVLKNDLLPIYDARHNIDKVNATALSWITVKNKFVAAPNDTPVQYMTFNTPVGAGDDQVCGRVVVSDIHVAAGQQGGGVSDDPSLPFPDGCKTADLTGQQKALEFMLFDLSSCVQKDDLPPVPPVK